MDIERVLRQAIRDHPEDDLPWLAYADWLEERGDSRAELIRVRRRRLREGGEELAERERQLIKAHRDEWMPYLKPLGDKAKVDSTWGVLDTVRIIGGADKGLHLLAGQENIVVLHLAGDGFTTRGLRHLHALPNLEELYLDDTAVTNAGMRTLASLPRLRSLVLERTPVTDAGLRYLHSAPHLVSIRFHGTETAEEGRERWKASRMKRFRKKPPEEQRREAEFVLRRLGYASDWMERPITELNLSQSQTSDLDLEYIACFPDVEEIDLVETLVTGEGLRHLSGLKRLRKLNLGRTRVQSLDGLTGMKGLQELLVNSEIGQDDFTDEGTVALPTLTGLEFLEFPGCALTDLTLRRLADLRNIRYLNLSCAGGFSDSGLANLAGLNRLEHLDLSFTRGGNITAEGLRHLAGLDRLTYLKLENHPITNSGLVHLRGLAALQYLGLHGTRVTWRGAERLLTFLPNVSISITGHEYKRE